MEEVGMRHSRRAVMAERYKLYAKKNIFNSRYLVRNVQIGLAVIILMATVVGAIVLICSEADEEVVATDTKVSVKEALFSNSEERKSVQKEGTSEQTTEVMQYEAMTKKVQKEFENTITLVANNAEKAAEEKKQEEQPKSEFENKCIANVDETLNIRKEPSTEADFVGSMNPGAIAIVKGTEGEWTKIKSGDVEGYVLSEYILTGEGAEQLAKDYLTLRGTVLEDGVNIRSEKSTDAEILTVMDKDDVITVLEKPTDETVITENDMTNDIVVSEEAKESDVVTEEVIETEDNMAGNAVAQNDTTETVVTEQSTTESVMAENTTAENTTTEVIETEAVEDIANGETEDDIQWIPVMLEDGQTGYISADLVEVDELYEIAVSAEELQRRAQEEAEAEEAARRAAEEEAARQAAAQAVSQQTSTTSNNTSNTTSNSSDDAYQGATTKPVTATESGECIGTFTITAYCGCKKCSAGNGKTASGTTPTEGRTIAADTSILPFGTQVVIDGIVYTVEDRGSGVSGNHIDIFFATHDKAIAFGRKSVKVYKY